MEISVPTLLRIKPNALFKTGKYLRKENFRTIALFWGEGIKNLFGSQLTISLESSEIAVRYEENVTSCELETILKKAFSLPDKIDAIVAIGGGKVIDYSKYIAFLLQLPVIAIPTSVSNDGFASPGASLYVNGKRRSLKARIPYGVVIDTEIISKSPVSFTISGIGDLISKYTAIQDWKLAWYAVQEPVNDFAVLISKNAVETMVHYNNKDINDLEFIRLICGCLVMSGIAMEVSGSSRPASGSEHLISHAYDMVASSPTLHGIQVGVATYAISAIQRNRDKATIKKVLNDTGFFTYVTKNPLNKNDFIKAIRLAPEIKSNYYTILSEKENIEALISFIEEDDICKQLIV
ncbi:MAG: iron-containing alcohol dehydrogenase family protein [Chitinispirillaceae bacterium]|nr:iron-containing alcohol dehydrogenase family protein [Chitinispirillaceae bacterium]